MTSNYKAASERTDEAERLLTSAVPQTQRTQQPAQHTPGPWEVRRRDSGSPHHIPVFDILAPNPDAGKNGVCYSGSHFAVTTELDNEADARLIAAAPELLQLLRLLRAECYEDESGAITRPSLLTLEFAAKAIARAEGRAI